MRQHYVTLEEAHPPFTRPAHTQFASALIRAMSRAAAQGCLRIAVPQEIRGELLARKKRHSFSR